MRSNNKILSFLVIFLILFISSCSDEKNISYPDGSDLSIKYKSTLKHALGGSVQAQMDIAYAYIDGDGVPIDNDKAIAWLKYPAESGNDEAQFNLGVYYFNGAKNGKGETYFKKAFFWNLKQANKSDKDAQYAIAIMYSDGLGVKKDKKKAFEWYLKSAKNGHSISQRNLGSFYLSGNIVKKDENKALKWFKKAAENNEVDSMFELGRFYRDGKSIEKNIINSYKWMKLSLFKSQEAGSNNETVDDRKVEFNKMKSTMSKEQMYQGDLWVKKKTGS